MKMFVTDRQTCVISECLWYAKIKAVPTHLCLSLLHLSFDLFCLQISTLFVGNFRKVSSEIEKFEFHVS